MEAMAEGGDCNGKLSSDRLTQIVRKEGWPAAFRPLMWANCGNALKKKAEDESGITYPALLAFRRPPQSNTFISEIERDLGRTLPGQRGPRGEEDYFSSEEGRSRLRNVLVAYSTFNPTVGYCQSMNFLAAILILQIDEEEAAFWVLATVVERILPMYYHRSLLGLSIDQAVLKDYLCAEMPAVCKKFEELSCDLSFVSTNWLLCIFINSLSWDCVNRIMDILLHDGDAQILLRASAAVVKLMQNKILACKTQEDLLMVLKPKEGTLTLEKGKAIEADQLIKVVFTALPPIPDLPQRRALLDQSFRDKLRFSPHIQLAPCPIAGI